MKKNLTIYISIVLAAILLALSFVSSYHSISESEEDRFREQITELANVESDFIESYIGDIVQRLSIEANFVSEMCDFEVSAGGFTIQSTITNIITSNAEDISAKVMFVKSAKGDFYVSNNIYNKVINAIDLSDSFLGGAAVSEVFTEYEGDNFISISVPIFSKDKKIVAVLGGLYTTNEFRSIVDVQLFDGQGYIGIIQKDGTFVYKSENQNTDMSIDNMFDVSNYTFSDGYSFESFKSLIDFGKTGITRYIRKDNAERYCCFMPLGIRDWYIILCVPMKTLYNFSAISYRHNIVMAIEIFIVLVILLAIIEIKRRLSNREVNRINDEMRAANDNLRISEERFKIAISHSSQMLLEFDFTTKMLHSFFVMNDEIFGSTKETKFSGYEFLKTNVHPDSRIDVRNSILSIKNGDANETSCEIRLLDSLSGQYLWYKMTATAITDNDGKVIKAFGSLENINSRHEETERLKNKADHDMLTGLLNRAAFEAAVSDSISVNVNSGSDKVPVLIILDIDNFKGINDTLGHGVGDIALKTLAAQMQSIFRKDDIVARLGGDEFIIWMSNVKDIMSAASKIDTLNICLKSLSETNSDIPRISVSAGASYVSLHDDFQTAYKKSDDALYKAKNTGKGKCVINND